MTWKLALDVGFFDQASGDVARPLDAGFVQQVIVQAGGRLPQDEHPDDIARNRVVAAIREAGKRPVLGYLVPEFVVLHESGFIMTAIGNGPNPAALAFLRMMVAEGCIIWTEDGEATQSVLDNLALTEARWAALKKAKA